ncbi:MAG: germination lipoprotein GerS-related protein [Clostridium sp.]|uniref:germination lipoprotein GerS-related protein n=1 Tax=Clostridium TaxID=1485 RepID=UPI0018A8DB27|nr:MULTISPECIES: germination lipoprotein GerS-related protein [Clostridium]MDB1970999.1 germination lipoprotein GerS-related protein [Clostridium tertium]MDU1568586.1 germination lipoprotein GerS-related protein [Clostridium sp.]MDU2461358.1 germination lipoprotein GerS-related protein [Clostridium sp.]MDU3348911.1 germination lipoprotein GerS-related protein [Clostridium sp.]MDU3408352.1 germination lipoprotein GerS-related protein [Clostridium sp.]
MKKKLLLILMVCIPFISIILVILFRATAEPTNEEIIKSLKEIKCYSTRVEYIIKNTRGEDREETTQYYSKDIGGRIDFGEDRSKIYKDNKVIVKDGISNKEYTMENDMDEIHSLAFLNKLLSYPIDENGIKEGQEEWGDTAYIEFTCEVFLKNDHLDKVKIFIDKQEKTPIGAIIYDKDGKDRIRIVYRDFEKLKQLDSGLLE